MLRLALCLSLAACGADPVQTPTDPAVPPVPGYEFRLGDQDSFTHACDISGGQADLSCVIAQFHAVGDDIDACALAKGVASDVVEDQRWNYYLYEDTADLTDAEAQHLERTAELAELRNAAQSILPCRVSEADAAPIHPFLEEAWAMGGCVE